jgi:hypothetical protein
MAMTDSQRRELLRSKLDGHWEYVCRVTPPASFEDNELGRGGIMVISVSNTWAGLTARIIAERLWATTSREDTPGDRTPLAKSIQWEADGGVILDVDRLSFEYFSGDGRGVTKDKFQLLEESGTLYMSQGTFKHQRADGHRVEGTVQLRKMRDFADLKWAPSDVNPAGTVVQSSEATDGDQPHPNGTHRELRGGTTTIIDLKNLENVAIGVTSGNGGVGELRNLPLTAGDLSSLATALSEIGVPGENVDQIKQILESEKPTQGAIGSRTAEWVGDMITKSLLGAWKLENGISLVALSELILRFRGLK